MKKLFLVIIGVALIGILSRHPDVFNSFDGSPAPGDQQIATAFENRQSDLQVGGEGVVRHILPDDNSGRRHQKFILEMASGQTLLISHNIDIAPRIDTLREGDTVAFFGEYEWNAKGGVVHWTHHDPGGRHADGWLKHKGVTYQ